MSLVADIAGAVLLLLGSFLCLSAAVGLVRFPDVLTRMHAATKPQVLGLILVLTGVALSLRSWPVTTMVLLIVLLQIMTAPVSAHIVSRRAYRSGQWDSDDAVVDDLAADLESAGFHRESADDASLPDAIDDVDARPELGPER